MGSQKSYALPRENRAGLSVECRPSRVFSGLIEKFWFSDKDCPNIKTFEILPDGNFDLVFILNDSCGTLLFAGPYTRMAAIPIFSGKEYFGVRFRTGKMPMLADIQPAELVDTVIELPKMLGMSIDSLSECLISARGIDAKRAFIELIFQKAGIELLVRRILCNRCTELIELCKGRIKVHDVACHVGTSMRTLERTFLRDLGISPKMFIRLVRFQNTVEKLKNGRYPTLTNVAYNCGYADQSHFIKDFQELAGRLPSAA
ncbi:MAG: helix-turn-helix transcriptional regulator [Deltaproteobacteria bacterium]|nr:helix-turn-helix transcriptional regulator [Deltaproteobacteria bacterium]